MKDKDELNKSELSKEKDERVSGDELKDDNIINRLNIDKDSLRKNILKKKLKITRNLQNDSQEDKKNITSDKKDKILFINNLLDYSVKKKIDNKTRERLFNLISKEVDSSSLTKEDVERIVEEKLNSSSKSGPNLKKVEAPNSVKGNSKSNLPKYFDPKNIYKFLFEYNQNNILRSTCHDIDSNSLDLIKEYCKTDEYDFKAHLSRIIEAYEKHEKKYPAPYPVKALMRGYLSGKDYKGDKLRDGWSSDNIKEYWLNSNLNNWAKNNPGFPPNPSDGLSEREENVGYEFEGFRSKISGKIIQNFRDLVMHFKDLFHIRSDNSLKSLIEKKNHEEGWNKIIEFNIEDKDLPTNVELFTDVDKLTQAYKKFIDLIIECSNKLESKDKPKVKLRLTEKVESIELSIHHINSVYGKSFINTLDRGFGQTYSTLITKQINGLCNLYLNADFGQGEFAQINLWDGQDRIAKKLESFTGVEHILVFPKR